MKILVYILKHIIRILRSTNLNKHYVPFFHKFKMIIICSTYFTLWFIYRQKSKQIYSQLETVTKYFKPTPQSESRQCVFL